MHELEHHNSKIPVSQVCYKPKAEIVEKLTKSSANTVFSFPVYRL